MSLALLVKSRTLLLHNYTLIRSAERGTELRIFLYRNRIVRHGSVKSRIEKCGEYRYISSANESSKKSNSNFNPFPFTFQQELTITIEDIANTGLGVGRVLLPASPSTPSLTGQVYWVVMVPLCVKGEVVKVRVHTNRHNFSEADLVQVISPSPNRVEPRCQYFNVCGGCQYQHIDIETQRKLKQSQVRNALKRIGGISFPSDEHANSRIIPQPLSHLNRSNTNAKIDTQKIEFIKGNTSLITAPLVPEVKLHLATEAFPIWRKTEEELEAEGVPPPFWAFAWAGGQALSRYILDNPDIVRGKTVLDFGSGSGIVGIAAALSGAKSVVAADIDVFATVSIVMNAAANEVERIVKVEADDVIGSTEKFDVILVGDMLYEKPLADRLMPWLLESTILRGSLVLLGDPGRSYFPKAGLKKISTYNVKTTRELEDREIRETSVHSLIADEPSLPLSQMPPPPPSPPSTTTITTSTTTTSTTTATAPKVRFNYKSPVSVSNVVGIDEQSYGYRAKITPHYKNCASKKLELGFFQRGSRSHVDIDSCLIASDKVNSGFKLLKDNLKSSQALEVKVPTAIKSSAFETLLVREHDNGVSLSNDETVYQTIEDKFNNKIKFSYKSGEFFQNNLFVLPHLVDHVLDLVCRPYNISNKITNNDGNGYINSESYNSSDSNRCSGLLDVYCGSGLFSLFASKRTQLSQIIGIEMNKMAVDSCIRNAALNKISNVSFHRAKVESLALEELSNRWGTSKKVNVGKVEIGDRLNSDETAVVLDPPRLGCARDFLEQLLEFRPRRIVYVSCEPTTQARDARQILESGKGYEIESIVPFDMFPQTRHIENVISFVR